MTRSVALLATCSVALVALFACGARTGLSTLGADTDAGAGSDARPPDPPACAGSSRTTARDPQKLPPISPRTGGRAVYDARRDRVVIYGGLRGSGDYPSDMVVVTLSPPASGLASVDVIGWTESGTAEDTDNDRVFVVGGMVRGDFSGRSIVLRPDGDRAFRSTPLATFPIQVRAPALGWDPVGRRLVVFGGWTGITPNPRFVAETWVLAADAPGATWRQLASPGGPPGQEDAVMVHAPGIGLLMVASVDGSLGGEVSIWVLAYGSERWEERRPPSSWRRSNWPSATWLAGSCQLVVWDATCAKSGHAVRFSGGAPTTVAAFDYPNGLTATVFGSTTWDVRRERAIAIGGYDCRVDNFLTVAETFDFR